MGKTYLWDNKGVWIERGPITFGYANYDFYLLDPAGAEVNGKTLRQIPADSYKSELEKIDVYVVRKGAGTAEVNKAAVQDPDAVIVVGMDQWVLTDALKRAAICTSGIIGCIGVGFIAGNKACVTHLLAKGQQLQEVAGGFALRVVGQNNWQFYKNDSPLKLFAGKPIVLVSSSVRYCTNWGRLSAQATDSRGD